MKEIKITRINPKESSDEILTECYYISTTGKSYAVEVKPSLDSNFIDIISLADELEYTINTSSIVRISRCILHHSINKFEKNNPKVGRYLEVNIIHKIYFINPDNYKLSLVERYSGFTEYHTGPQSSTTINQETYIEKL